ncbi:MAG: ATP-binding protein [bacterium]
MTAADNPLRPPALATADALLEDAPCGFVVFADDGTVRHANATLLSMLGRAREAVVGRHFDSVLTVGSRIFYQTHLFPLLRLHGRADEIFLALRAADGEEVGALLNAVRRERDGVWATECVLMHVRERPKFEDALLRAKKEAEGARAEAEKRRDELLAANELLRAQAIRLELSTEQLSRQAEELEMQAEELQVLNDTLTEHAEELERQRKVAEEATRAKGDFLAAMSHELRTPLNAIGGYVQLLEMGIHGPLAPAQLEALEKVTRSQRHLLRLINEVLNLARIEARGVEYELRPVRLKDVVAAVLPMIEPQAAARRLSLTVDVPASLCAMADPPKAEQVLLNLLSNAVKFTPPGGHLRVVGSEDPGSHDRVQLIVEDTGLGIPADRLAQVFEPFVQVDVSPAGRSEGSGLGLAISRDLARGMGGNLTATSTPGIGSRFCLELPVARNA